MTISPLSGGAGESGESAPVQKSPVNKEAFLQLLVAQIKNQNPLNPADGVQFLTQLAQFSELEQMMEIRNEVSALRTQMADAQKTTEKAGA